MDKGILAGDPLLLAKVFLVGIHGVVLVQLSGKLQEGVSIDDVFMAMLGTLSLGAKGPNFDKVAEELMVQEPVAKSA